jgi:hypothetical protein
MDRNRPDTFARGASFAALLVFAFAASGAETFDARAQRAKALEDTPPGRAYQDAMWPLVEPFLTALIKQCIADDAKHDMTPFVWVATLTAEGKLADAQVQPETAIARCFAAGMEQAPFPKPPQEFGDEGLPLTFNMRLHPMN